MTSNSANASSQNKKNGLMFWTLTKRHLKMIFSDKIRMFYTLMVPVIILLVYILFLRDMELNAIENELLKLGMDTTNKALLKHITTIVDAWMLSGIISISVMTISLQTNSLLVEDKEKGINKDFASSPIKKTSLIASYFVYNFIITVALTLMVVVASIIFLAAYGEMYLTIVDVLTIIGIVLFSTVPTTLITVFVCIFIKTEPVLASVIAAVSAAIGFLTGAYMPITMLALPIQYLCGFIPGTYTCALTRFAYLSGPISSFEAYLVANPSILPSGVTVDTVTDLVNSNFGFNVNFFGLSVTPSWDVLVTGIFLVIFLILNIFFSGKLAKVEEKPIKILKKRLKKIANKK